MATSQYAKSGKYDFESGFMGTSSDDEPMETYDFESGFMGKGIEQKPMMGAGGEFGIEAPVKPEADVPNIDQMTIQFFKDALYGELPEGIGALQKPTETAVDFWSKYTMTPEEEEKMAIRHPNLMAMRYAAASLLPGGRELASPIDRAEFSKKPIEYQRLEIIGETAGWAIGPMGAKWAGEAGGAILKKIPWFAKNWDRPIGKYLTDSNWFRQVTNKERGLVIQTVDNMQNSGMSDAEILKVLRNRTKAEYQSYFEEALRKRGAGQQGQEPPMEAGPPGEPSPIRPPPTQPMPPATPMPRQAPTQPIMSDPKTALARDFKGLISKERQPSPLSELSKKEKAIGKYDFESSGPVKIEPIKEILIDEGEGPMVSPVVQGKPPGAMMQLPEPMAIPLVEGGVIDFEQGWAELSAPKPRGKLPSPAVETIELGGPEVKPAVKVPELTKIEQAGHAQVSTKKGKIGEMMSAGQIVQTATGRETTPFPKVDINTNIKAINTLKRVDKWLIDNVRAEAASRGDEFNQLQFDNMNLKNLSPSDTDSAEMYLFGDEQPPVLKPFLKDLKPTEPTVEDEGMTAPIKKPEPVLTEQPEIKPIKPIKPSGLSPDSTFFNTDPTAFDGYAWRVMNKKELISIGTGTKTYGGGKAKRGQFLAPTPENASQYKTKGKYLVEFAGIQQAEGETISNIIGKDNVVSVKQWDGKEWVDVGMSATQPPVKGVKTVGIRKTVTTQTAKTLRGWAIAKGGIKSDDPPWKGEIKSYLPLTVKRKKGLPIDELYAMTKEDPEWDIFPDEQSFFDALITNMDRPEIIEKTTGYLSDELKRAEDDYYKERESFLDEYTEEDIEQFESQEEAYFRDQEENSGLTQDVLNDIFQPKKPSGEPTQATILKPEVEEPWKLTPSEPASELEALELRKLRGEIKPGEKTKIRPKIPTTKIPTGISKKDQTTLFEEELKKGETGDLFAKKKKQREDTVELFSGIPFHKFSKEVLDPLKKLYADHVGDPLWNYISETLPETAGKKSEFIDKINKGIIYDYRKDPGFIELRDDTHLRINLLQKLYKELADRMAKFPKAEQIRISQIIRGGVTATPTRYTDAFTAAKEFARLLKELQDLGVMGPDNQFRQLTKKEIADKFREIDGINTTIEKLKKRLEPIVRTSRTVRRVSEDVSEEITKTEKSETTGEYETKVSRWTQANEDRVKEALLSRGFAEGEANQMISRIKESVVPLANQKGTLKEIKETIEKIVTKTITQEITRLRTFDPSMMARAKNSIIKDIKEQNNNKKEILERIKLHYKMSGKQYLRKAYEKIESEKGFMRNFYTQITRPRLKKGYEIQRKDLSKAYEEELGIIKRAPYLVYKGLSHEAHDAELMKMFDVISKNKAWAISPKEWANIQSIKGRKHLIQKYEKFKPLPVTDKLGPLSGALVDPYIYDDLNQAVEIRSEAMKAYDGLLTLWKTGKVVYNPATHARNILSNAILADWGGLPPHRIDVYARAARDLLNKTGYWKEANENTMLLGKEWAATEITKFLQETADLKDGNFLSKSADLIKKGLDIPGDVYQGVEQFFKLAVYSHNREGGATIKEAAKKAEDAIFNYQKIPPAIRWAKRWYSPFITFSYKAVPRFAETAVKQPWKIAKYAALFLAVEETTRRFYGESKEEVEREKRVLPDYMRNQVLPGMLSHMRVPYKDEYNRSKYLDLSFILPWGDVAEQWGQSHLVGRPFLPSHPMWVSVAEIAFDEILFTGQELTIKDLDEGSDYWKKIGTQLWRQAMPSLAGSYSFNKLMTAWTGEKDWAGRERSVPEAVIDVFFGLKIRSIDYNEELGRRLKGLDIVRAKMEKEYSDKLRKIWMNPAPDTERNRKKIIDLYAELNEDIDKILKKGEYLIGR